MPLMDGQGGIVSQLICRPDGACSSPVLPTACAVGCILAPLRGYLRTDALHTFIGR
jgi:hypothetical protein